MRLIDAGILSELAERARPKYFVADSIFEVAYSEELPPDD